MTQDSNNELQFSRSTIRGYGGKGGGGGRVAKEAPDSLHSIQFARMLDAVNIGPVGSMGDTPQAVMRNVFFNGTPLVGENGEENFPGVEVHVRYGTQDQDPIPGFPGAENTVSVGVQVKQTQPWTQLVTTPEIDALRVTLSTDRLSQQNTKNGDLNGYFIDYVVELRVGSGEYEPVVTASMRGKTTQRYTRTHRINLPPNSAPWTLRVRRTSADTDGDSAISSGFYVDAYTEVVDTKLRYPMIALMGYKIPASLFSSIPARAVRGKGRQIRVPSNYDAVLRRYDGIWDGTFKLSVCANPAWVLLDMITNDIFGLGERINLGMVDRWELYKIAQYCDELVPDGRGGMEPRFRAIGQMMTREDAYRVLQDIASVFRGMTYAADGTVITRADMPGKPVFTYCPANVVGEFQYSGTTRRTHFNIARVSYNNPDDFGRQKMLSYTDRRAVARFGVRDTETTAFMCYSPGQALRMAKWLVLTSQEQDRMVKFKVGMDYALVLPGEIVNIADNVLAGAMISGRFREVVSASVMVLDRKARIKPGDTLIANLPDGTCQERRVAGVEVREDDIKVTVAAFSERPNDEAVWCVLADDLKPFQFRVRNVALTGPMEAEITAVVERAGKHEAVDYGTRLDPPDNSVLPSLQTVPPSDVRLSSYTGVDQNAAQHVLRIEWVGSKQSRGYAVQWRRDDSDWIGLPETTLEAAEVPAIRAGNYQARVQAISALEVRSSWTISDMTRLDGTLEPPPQVAYLRATNDQLYGISVSWGYRESISTVRRAELWFSASPNHSAATLLSEISYPGDTFSIAGLPAGTEYWFWIRLVDSLGEKGEFYPSVNAQGVHGITNTNAKDYLEAIKNEVVSSELGKQLLQDIEDLDTALNNLGGVVDEQGTTLGQHTQQLIEQAEQIRVEVLARVEADKALADALAAEAAARQNGLTDLSNQLQQEVQDRVAAVDDAEQTLQAQIDTIQAQLAEIEGIKAWDPTVAYVADDIVSWNGGLYRAKVASTNVAPSNAATWEKIGDYSSLAEAVAGISSELTEVKIVQAAQATKITTLETATGQNTSKIATLETTTAAQAQRLTTVETKAGENAGKIQTLETTTASLAQRASTLEATTATQGGKITTLETVTASLVTRTGTLEQTSATHTSKITTLEQASADYALRITELRATATDQDASLSEMAKVTATNINTIRRLQVKQGDLQSSIETIETVNAGMAQRVTTLETVQGQQGSKITTLEQTTVTLANRTTTLETSSAQQASKIQTIEQTEADQAQRLSNVETTSGQNSGKIATLEQTTANLAQRTTTLETTSATTANRVATLETATSDMALRMTEVRAMTADTDAMVYELSQATANNARTVSRVSARADLNSAEIVNIREVQVTDREATATEIRNLNTKTDTNAAAIRNEELARSNADSALATRITTLEAETAEGFDNERSWTFDAGVDGWQAFNAANASMAWVNQSPYFLRVTQNAGTTGIGRAEVLLNQSQQYDARQFPIVRVRVRFPTKNASGIFPLFFTPQGSGNVGAAINMPVDRDSTAWQVIDFDLATSPDFQSATSVGRLIVGDVRQGTYELDYVAIGRYGVPIARSIYTRDINVLTNSTGANAQAVERLDVQFGGLSGTVQTQSQAIVDINGKLTTNWNVKVQQDVNGTRYLAGIGVGIESAGNGQPVQSTIAMIADRFVLMTAVGGIPQAVFSVVNGQAFLRTAFIQDGTITTAKIADAAITNAKIGYAAVGTANIQDGSIQTAKIGDAQVLTAKIGVAQIDTLRIAGGSVVAGNSMQETMNIGSSNGSGNNFFSHSSPTGAGGYAQYFISVYCSNAGSPGAGYKFVTINTGSDGVVYEKSFVADQTLPVEQNIANYKSFLNTTFSWVGGYLPGGSSASIGINIGRPGSGQIQGYVRIAIFTFQR